MATIEKIREELEKGNPVWWSNILYEVSLDKFCKSGLSVTCIPNGYTTGFSDYDLEKIIFLSENSKRVKMLFDKSPLTLEERIAHLWSLVEDGHVIHCANGCLTVDICPLVKKSRKRVDIDFYNKDKDKVLILKADHGDYAKVMNFKDLGEVFTIEPIEIKK